MKILVTGTSGFLGNAIRHYLINKGYDTYGTTRSRPPEDDKEFHFDITKDSCRKTFNNIKFDVIIHCIGLTDESAPYWLLEQINVFGTKKILQYAKTINCNHFIFLSSVSVYGINVMGQNRTENSVKISPRSYINKYGMTKAQAELEVMRAGIPYTVLRLPLMIGKGDKMVTPKLVDLIKDNKVYYLGNGNKLISIMPVKNLCVLTSILIEKGALNQSLHAPSFHITLNSFVKEHSRLAKLPLQIRQGSIQFFLINLPNIRKVILFYSWRGSHFIDSKIRSLIPEYHDVTSWKTALQENIGQVMENL
ncbi:MAG: NAD-dependent epimerase/dehydratase family protein [Candidatus Thorarchaeota archaeon]